jgi:hypothetical protein
VSSNTIGEAQQTPFRSLPILLCPLYSANTIGAMIFTPLTGEAMRRKKNPQNLLIGATNSPRFANKRRVQRSTNNLGYILYMALILLAQCRSYRLTYFFRTCL